MKYKINPYKAMKYFFGIGIVALGITFTDVSIQNDPGLLLIIAGCIMIGMGSSFLKLKKIEE